MDTRNKVDSQWFKLQIARAGYSLRGFAAAIKLDPSGLHRTLEGKRKPGLKEIERMASVLHPITTNEILAHMGMKVAGADLALQAATVKGAPGRAPLAGDVDAADGVVTFIAGVKPARGSAVIALALHGDPFLEGWRVLCVPSDISAMPLDDVGCGIVQVKDGRMLLRKIRPGFTRGRFDLGPAFGFGGREDDAEVVGVIPVVGLEPG